MSHKSVLSYFFSLLCQSEALFTSRLKGGGELVIGNRDWLSSQAKAAIIQPLTDEAIGVCYQSQLWGLSYALYMGSNPDTMCRHTQNYRFVWHLKASVFIVQMSEYSYT